MSAYAQLRGRVGHKRRGSDAEGALGACPEEGSVTEAAEKQMPEAGGLE